MSPTEEGKPSMNSTIDVRTSIPVETYKQLWAVAQHNHTTVGALIAELTRRGLGVKVTKKAGRKSGYTPELGERILEARWMHRGWHDIARDEHISHMTAKRYAEQAEQERRAALARNNTTNTKENAA